MMEMPIRTRRRLQDATRRLREDLQRRTGERQQVNSLHRQRMTCSDSVHSFANTQDWTGGMSLSPSGRFRVVEEAKPKAKLFSRDGIRRDAAWIILAAVIALCVMILAADIAGIGVGSRSIARMDNKIANLDETNESMRKELTVSAGDVSVCTEAVKLNLISGYGAQTISLTVPQEMSAGAVMAEARSNGGVRMSGYPGN